MKAQQNNLRRSSTFSIFRNGNYMLLFFGGLVSRIGNGVHYVAVCWYVLDRYDSMALGTILTIASLPAVLLGPFCGVLVDRLERKKLIIWMDIIRGVLVLLIAQLLLRGMLSYFTLLIGTFLISLCGTLFNPAISATIPNIVKDSELSKANSLESLSSNLTGVIGASLGGILIGLFGVPWALIINGISFLLSAFSEVFIQIPSTKHPKSVHGVSVMGEVAPTSPKKSAKVRNHNLFGEMMDGLKFIFSNRLLRAICATSIVLNFFFIGALSVALPYVVKELMGYGGMRFGLMDSFFPAGAILGSVIIILLPEIKRFYRLTVAGLSTHGMVLILLGLTISPLLLAPLTVKNAYSIMAGLMLIMGIVDVVINVPIITLFQRLVPDEIRGRFFAILGTLTQGLIPLAYFLSGVILNFWSAHMLMIGGGLAVILIALNMTRIEEFREL